MIRAIIVTAFEACFMAWLGLRAAASDEKRDKQSKLAPNKPSTEEEVGG